MTRAKVLYSRWAEVNCFLTIAWGLPMRIEIDRAEINNLFGRLGRAFLRGMCVPVVEHDFDKRQRYIAAADDPSWVYRNAPTSDPAYNDLDGKGFWLNVKRLGVRAELGEREMIAHCAVRVWQGSSLHDLFVH